MFCSIRQAEYDSTGGGLLQTISIRVNRKFIIVLQELFITLPYFYRSFITFQVLTNQVWCYQNKIVHLKNKYFIQIVYFILAEKVLCPNDPLLSLYLLVFFTVVMYVRSRIEVVSHLSSFMSILNPSLVVITAQNRAHSPSVTRFGPLQCNCEFKIVQTSSWYLSNNILFCQIGKK